MRVKKDFMLRQVANNYFVVPVGKVAKEFNGIITLTETGAYLWKELQKDSDFDSLVDSLIETYDISLAIAKEDTKLFIKSLEDADLLD